MFSRRERTPTGGTERKLRRFSERYRRRPTAGMARRVIKLLMKSGRYDEAFRWAKHAKARYPHSNRLLKLYRKLRTTKTRASLRQAKNAARRNPSAENLVRLAELLRISGKWKQAWKAAVSADEVFPDHWQVQLVFGKLHFDRFSRTRNDDDGWAAVEYLDNSRCLQPGNYSTLILLAISLIRLRSYRDALVVIEETLRVAPSDKRALGLRTHVRKILAGEQQPARKPQRTPTVERSITESCDTELLERVLQVPGVVGVCHFNKRGQQTGSSLSENDTFDFSVDVEVFESMAGACRLDTQRIGLGDFRSCSLSGEGWGVDYHRAGDGGVLGFFEGAFTPERIEEAVSAAVGELSRVAG